MTRRALARGPSRWLVGVLTGGLGLLLGWVACVIVSHQMAAAVLPPPEPVVLVPRPLYPPQRYVQWYTYTPEQEATP
jgi:hypothetical protein